MSIEKILVELEDYVGVEPSVEVSPFQQGVRVGLRQLLQTLKFRVVQHIKGYGTLSELEEVLVRERQRNKNNNT